MTVTRAAGTFPAVESTNFTTITPSPSWTTVGDRAIVVMANFNNSTNLPTAVASTKVTGWANVTTGTFAGGPWTLSVWAGTVNATGSDSVTITWASGTPTSAEIGTDELTAGTGTGTTWANVTAATANTSSNPELCPSLTSSTAPLQAYWAWGFSANAMTAGNTTGFGYTISGSGDAFLLNGSLAASTAFAPNVNTTTPFTGTFSAAIFSASGGVANPIPDLTTAQMQPGGFE